jgi:hypothetical protein
VCNALNIGARTNSRRTHTRRPLERIVNATGFHSHQDTPHPQCIRGGQRPGQIGAHGERLAIATHGHTIDGKRGPSRRQRLNLSRSTRRSAKGMIGRPINRHYTGWTGPRARRKGMDYYRLCRSAQANGGSGNGADKRRPWHHRLHMYWIW